MEPTQADEVFASRRGAVARSYMLKRGNIAGRCAVLLASCFCLFTLAQTARPLQSIALFSHTGVAVRYHKLTRHTLQEVSRRVADLSAGATTQFGDLTLEVLPRNSRPSQATYRSGRLAAWSTAEFRPPRPTTPLNILSIGLHARMERAETRAPLRSTGPAAV